MSASQPESLPDREPDKEPDSQSASQPESRQSWASFFAILLIFFCAQSAIAEGRYIPSGSMLPTLQLQDRLLVEKVSRNFAPPRRGEILVFEHPLRPEPQGLLDGLARWQGYG